MKKCNVVKENKDFQNIINNGKFYKSLFLIIYTKDKEPSLYRFGISVGKKIGNAVTRNKIKRQMRNIVDKYKKDYENGLDYIIMVRKEVLNTSFIELENDYIKLLDRIKTSRKENK